MEKGIMDNQRKKRISVLIELPEEQWEKLEQLTWTYGASGIDSILFSLEHALRKYEGKVRLENDK